MARRDADDAGVGRNGRDEQESERVEDSRSIQDMEGNHNEKIYSQGTIAAMPNRDAKCYRTLHENIGKTRTRIHRNRSRFKIPPECSDYGTKRKIFTRFPVGREEDCGSDQVER
jgi:hypothetical protein